jgi:PAS domain S-box-containing protein
LGDRNLPAAIAFALSNAAEPIIIAWLLEREHGSEFNLDSFRRVLSLFIAAGMGTALSGLGGTAGFLLFHNTGASIPTIWLNWFASDAVGVVTVAPVVVALTGILRDVPKIPELAEGTSALVILAAASAIGFTAPTDYWFTILPLTLLLPLLIWPAARCPPAFTAAAVFIVAVAIVCTITFGIGRLGDSGVSLSHRVYAARGGLLAISACALVLAALFAERRRHEAALRERSDQLRLALDGAELGVWSIDTKTGRFMNDIRDQLIHSHDPEAPPRSLTEARSAVHPDDLPGLDAAFGASARSGRSYKTEYRLASIPGQMRHPRWVEVEGTVRRDADGRAVQLLGVTRDITERKQTEQALRESEAILRARLGALPAAIYVTDAGGCITYCNQAAADLWGRIPKLGEDRWCDLARFYHSDGTPMATEDCPTEIALKQDRIVRNVEAILERPDGTRIPIVPYPTPLRDGAGTIVGVLNMTVDISERKKAERALAERNTQFALAGKAALVGSYAYDAGTNVMQVDEGYAALHGLTDGTTETARSAWQARAHPQDLARVEEIRRQAFTERWSEYDIEYRILRAEGDVRWIESRSFIAYSPDLRPCRVVGVNIDITERKRAEEHQRVLVAELDHRVKNVLATVSAVAAQTLDASSSMDHFVAAFDGRLKSMAKTHELLSEHRWRGIPLAELLRRELAPYAGANNTEIAGPEVILSADAGQVVGMVLHELVTNAAKHGALSTREGKVSVKWHRQLNGDARAGVVIEWQETGSSAKAASKTGYGMSVICELIPHELAGKANHVLRPEGARCQLEIPGRWVDATAPD